MLVLSPAQRKQTGAFYTPGPLAQHLAREVLGAWQRLHPHTHWADLKILDPAAGEGGLLLPFARELACLRATQEPGKPHEEILQDILTRQLYAADISAPALDKIPLPSAHRYCGNALGEINGKSVLCALAPHGFDIVLANPPYIGQKGHATIFETLRQNPLWAPYVTPKNDLLYYFFYLALHLLKPGGLAGFITTPYFATAAGGKMLRQTLYKQATFLRLINFENQHLFKEADPHILLSVFARGNLNVPCQVGQTNTLMPPAQLFYGPDHFLQTRPVCTSGLLARMAHAPYKLGEIARISTGLMTGCDRAFILTDAQKNALPISPAELTKLKPFFKNSDITAYAPHTTPRLWLIDFFYPNDRALNVQDYPHLLAHLAQFKEKLLARKQNNNGIDKQLAQGKFWFGSVRRKLNFEGEKLVLPHRAHTVKAAYSSGPWYASSDVYFITTPKPPYTLWTILGLLNSAPYLSWLQAHGKRKGNLLELYRAPLAQLPIPACTPKQLARLESLVRQLFNITVTKGPQTQTDALQAQLDQAVYELFR